MDRRKAERGRNQNPPDRPVSDRAEPISEAVTQALSHSDIVICTGGLGPTKDDITKHTLARLFGMKLVRNEAVYERVRRR